MFQLLVTLIIFLYYVYNKHVCVCGSYNFHKHLHSKNISN